MMNLTREKIEAALDRAYEVAAERSRQTGAPLVVVRDGELVEEVPPAKSRKQVHYDEELAAPETVVRDGEEQDD